MNAPQRKVRTSPSMRWRMYEAMKRAWIKNNQGASPMQYHRAIVEIAKKLGV